MLLWRCLVTVVKAGIGLLLFLVAVFLVLFLGGLASAWWEVRSEKRQGLTPTRPADDLRAKKRARGGGPLRSFAIWWHGVRTGIPQCWCGLGSLMYFDADPPNLSAGLGCTAWEAAHPQAFRIHDAAGTYDRSPVSQVPWHHKVGS